MRARLEPPRRFVDRVERLLGDTAVLAYARPRAALAVAALVSVLSGLGIRHLRVDADLSELLPASFPSVRALAAMKEHYGGVGYVVVVARDAEPEQLRRFADDLAPRLTALPEMRFVDHRRPNAFFEEHALYYLSLDELRDLERELASREARVRRAANPLYVDLEEEPAEALSVEATLQQRLRGGERRWMSAQLGETHYLDPERRVVAVLAKPAVMGFDLTAARNIIARTQEVIDGMDLAAYGPQLRVEIGGSYKKKVDQQVLIERDLAAATLAAFVLMTVFLAFHFRRLSAVVLVMLPLGLGTLWSYGFAGVTFATLNVLTGFLGAILSGMGIENGIHLLGRFEAEWRDERDVEEVLRATFGNTGRGVVVTALTTAAVFAVLGCSEFRAFREFGLLAAAGMLFFVAAYAWVLPALLGLALRRGWRPRDARGGRASPYVPWLVRHARALVLVCLVVFIAVGVAAPRASFNYNFRSLLASRLRSFELDRTIDRLVGYSQTPPVLFAGTLDDQRQVASALRERRRELGAASRVAFVASLADLVPEGQLEKREVLQRLHGRIAAIEPAQLSPDEQRARALALRMAAATPFTLAELPAQTRRHFNGQSEHEGVVLAYPAFDLSEGAYVRDLARELRGLRLPSSGEEVMVAGETLVLADILTMVSHEAPWVLSLAIVTVFATLWLVVGSWRSALACILPAAGSVVATLGLMALTGQQLNYINIILVPLFFGIGVDGGAHLITRMDAGEDFAHVFDETGRGVSGALLTNALGFAALVMADHRGLNTLGTMALLGLAVNLLACNVAFPAVVAAIRRRGGRGEA